MKANLHTHSYFSDGSESPESIAQRSADAGVGLIALSDHNTFAGCDRFALACDHLGVRSVRAVEIDCVQSDIAFHSELLAYFPDGDGSAIQFLLDQRSGARKERVLRALDRSRDFFGISDAHFTYDYFHQWVVEDSGYDLSCSLGFASLYLCSRQLHKFLITCWGVPLPDYAGVHDAFYWKELWSLSGILEVDSLYDTISSVTKSGGYAVLPHFGFHCMLDPERMVAHSDVYLSQLRIMRSFGLWGMELHPYRYMGVASAINFQVSSWADRLGFRLTAGSDFHGCGSTHHVFDSISCDFAEFSRDK